jgi:hypothetical protein
VGTASTTYKRSAGDEIPFTPGDSVVVAVPGAVGGYPAANIRAKTAEAFSAEDVVMPTGTNALQLRWTRASNATDVAMIVSLRFSPPGASGTLTRQVICSFEDDGIDSIPFRQYEPWSTNNGQIDDIVLTRLRTAFSTASDALLEVISTYVYPPPIR